MISILIAVLLRLLYVLAFNSELRQPIVYDSIKSKQIDDSIKTVELKKLWGNNYQIKLDSMNREDKISRTMKLINKHQNILDNITYENLDAISDFNIICGKIKNINSVCFAFRDDSIIEISKAAKKLQSALIRVQTRIFPQMRKSYIKISRNMMWKNDIDVYGSDGNGTINLVGGYFASNSHISESQKEISDMLKQLRFKRVNYKFSEYGEYTYYDLKTNKDSFVK